MTCVVVGTTGVGGVAEGVTTAGGNDAEDTEADAGGSAPSMRRMREAGGSVCE